MIESSRSRSRGEAERYVILAWPRYESAEELASLMEMAGAALAESNDVCLCLRHDPEQDGPLRDLPSRLEEAHAGVLGRGAHLDLLLLDEPIEPRDWPLVGSAVSCVLRLPSSASGPRAAFVRAVDRPIIESAPELRRAVCGWSETRRGDPIQRWLDKAYEECVPYLPPVRLDFCLTTACNLECAYCWQREKRRSLLTFEVLRDIVDSVAAVWPPNLTFTGGEPTVWPDFERSVSHARDVGVTNMLLCTNGVKLRDLEYAERIVSAGVSAINISVDTLDPERFESLRGYSISKLEETLSNCIALKKKFPSLQVTLASVLSKAVTPEDLHRVKTFCSENGFAYFTQTFLPTVDPAINERFALTDEEHEAFEKKLEWLDGRVADVVKRDWNPLTESRSAKCYKGITTAKIFPDGGVAFCWTSRVIGNVLEEPFIDLWASRSAREMREFIRDRRCRCKFDCDIFESLELPASARRVSARRAGD